MGGTPRSSIYRWMFHFLNHPLWKTPVSHVSKNPPMTEMEKTTLLHSKAPAIFGQTSDLQEVEYSGWFFWSGNGGIPQQWHFFFVNRDLFFCLDAEFLNSVTLFGELLC